MASIQRRVSKDGEESFRVGYRQDGKLRWTKTFEDGAGAVEAKGLIERLGPGAALAIIDQRHGRVTSGPPLLRDWFDTHLELLEADATPGTIADYRRMAERTWLPTLGPLPLDAITKESVKRWVAAQRKTPTARSVAAIAKAEAEGRPAPAVAHYSSKSIRNAHGLLSAVLASAVEAEHLVRNVAKGVGLPSDEAGRDMEVFTENEFALFVEAMQPHYRPLVQFLGAVGVRIGEATALAVRDVDLDGPMPIARIRQSWKKGEAGTYLGSTKSKRGRRAITLPPSLIPILRPLIDGRAADDFVFTAAQGGQIHAHRFRERQWQAALDKAGITKRLTPHSLRHTAASVALQSGVSPIVVQHRLGHESLDTTSKVYAHLLTGAQDEAAMVADRFISGATPQIES